MRTQVFAYKGFLGIQSDINVEGLVNQPLKQGQLGFVVEAKCVDIQPEALELLKKIRRSADDLGEIDIYRSVKGIMFSWLGGPLKMCDPLKVTGSYDYDPTLITFTKDIKTPEDFINYIDKEIRHE